MDDGWAIVQDRESCRIKARALRADLCNAGFVVNEDKSPVQVLDWLGITWNPALGTLKIVERRTVKIINSIDHVIEADFKVSAMSARQLASFTGQIISAGPAVGNLVLSTELIM